MYARITTDANGRLHDGSTCTIDGVTVAVPLRTDRGGSFAPLRIVAAICALDWEPVNYHNTLTTHDGYIEVLVDLPGSGT